MANLDEDASSEPTKVCSAGCGVVLDRTEFSKKQWALKLWDWCSGAAVHPPKHLFRCPFVLLFTFLLCWYFALFPFQFACFCSFLFHNLVLKKQV